MVLRNLRRTYVGCAAPVGLAACPLLLPVRQLPYGLAIARGENSKGGTSAVPIGSVSERSVRARRALAQLSATPHKRPVTPVAVYVNIA